MSAGIEQASSERERRSDNLKAELVVEIVSGMVQCKARHIAVNQTTGFGKPRIKESSAQPTPTRPGVATRLGCFSPTPGASTRRHQMSAGPRMRQPKSCTRKVAGERSCVPAGYGNRR